MIAILEDVFFYFGVFAMLQVAAGPLSKLGSWDN